LRIAHGKLISDKFNDDSGYFGWPFEKGAQKPHRSKLNGNAESVMIAAMFSDESAVAVIEMKISVELIGSWVIGAATIILRLPIAEKIDRHSRYNAG